MSLTAKQKEFLLKLADLCEEYKADFYYTRDDNGIHVEVEGDEIFVGHVGSVPTGRAKELRTVAEKQ